MRLILVETGWPGLTAYLVLWIGIVGLTFQTIHRMRGRDRALAIGLLGSWGYLSIHNLVDNPYINNTPLLIGVLLGWLAVLRQPSSDRWGYGSIIPVTHTRHLA